MSFIKSNSSVFAVLAMTASLAFATPTPSNMDVVWVGDNIVHNGVPMEIQSFHSADGVNGVLEFYRQTWGKQGSQDMPGFIENSVGEWAIISRIEDGKNTVVQVKQSDRGGSEGYISFADLNITPAFNKITDEFPKLGGSEVISSTESKDFNSEATTIVMTNGHSVDRNADFYSKKIVAMGWELNRRFSQDDTEMLFFVGPKSRIEVAISRSNLGKTTIFANVVHG